MGRAPALDIAPPAQRWMKEKLDRDVFRKSVRVLAVRVPATSAGAILRTPETRKFLADLPKLPSVAADPSGSNAHRLVVLRVTEQSDLTPEALTVLHEHQAEFTTHTIELGYDYWTADEIFHAILPEELLEGAPAGFAATGHLAHMNLNDEYLPYKHVIGQVILDKNKLIKTVVNKLNTIDTTFRFFQMELIAGEPNFLVEHHESDCSFTFDFTQVYWNSRLHTEHQRLVQLFKPEDVVADVFAGVGPFAIPAAKKGCAVLANDLNPNSFKYLELNIKNNGVDNVVRAVCEDGRDFILAAARRLYDNPLPAFTGPKLSKTQIRLQQRKMRGTSAPRQREASPPSASQEAPLRRAISHYVMNLPDSAITFLNAFRGIFSASSAGAWDSSGVYSEGRMPMVHCHCFTRELEFEGAEKDIRQRVEEQLGHALKDDVVVHFVRKVAPNKDMYCISFRLPVEVAFG